ncbi:MAG TPA: MmgE/PrpD family protein, partial [Beijerinckiaceae bacterium]|nr:MmgE/PrpD family protein [Beijerinckiaceae bacterium]
RVGIIDTVGVMLAGSQEHVAKIACQIVEDEKTSLQSTVVGRGLRVSPHGAAFANGVAVHAMDYDLTFGRGQAVAAVIPALFALAEARGASPSDVLAAFIVACEVAARLSRASPEMSGDGGWHTTGVIGAIAAAVGSARLIGLAPARVCDVVGISASMASGFTENFGTMTKPLHAGNAARNGITAAFLAARGFTASPVALEGPFGYFGTFSRGLPTDLSSFDDLGRVNNLVAPGYKVKLYPCGGLGHTSIDATLALREELAGRADEIAKIEVGICQHAFDRIGGFYPHSIESAKFSMPYIAAWTVLYGAPCLATFTEEAIADTEVRSLASKISHHVDPEFASEGSEAPGRVTVTLKNGQTFEKVVHYASGSPRNPMAPAQIQAKFFDCAGQAVEEDQAAKIFAWLDDLPNQNSFAEFWPLIRVARNDKPAPRD